ncbi:aromatase/cyclase [Streptomyces sp. NBC_00986]|uniref:aromatase/cyclase n=1 Tax=Streptomyces sp. NBC_00986 TaxID=2903702 RepID=UPI00386BD8E2|nr:aromatase/cyclase [Streptomyces sp. NBC_00986]WSX64476.1 aromatase/cyclase [Streptomyces sp. NBC_00986]
MPNRRVHHVLNAIDVAAPAGVVYGLIADSVRWPLFFPPSIHVERLDFDGVRERLRMWVTANGQVKSWTSDRVLDAARRTVSFRQTLPATPAASLGGVWTVEAAGAGSCRLTLRHEFTAVDDRAQDVAWLERAINANTRSELEQLRSFAERWTDLDALTLSFEDSVRVKGPAELVYDFLYRAADWPAVVPHVHRVDLAEPQAGVQQMTMVTSTAAGVVHGIETVRVCFPHAGRIVYKQVVCPKLVAAHTGEWSVVPDETGVTVVSQHSVVLRDDAEQRVLGAGTDLERARRTVRAELGRSSVQLLELAREHAKSAIHVLRSRRPVLGQL